MSKNRFEQVDGPEPDAITLILSRQADGPKGRIHCPAAASGGRIEEDQISPDMPARDAFRSSIKLANEIRAALVVADPDGVWDAEWGALYRVA
jgi:hypothetical protein